MSQQATKPFLHHKRVPCLSFTHCWAFWWSLLSNIHSSLSKRRIFGYKGTYFLAKSTLLNKKTDFIHATFSLCLAKTGRNNFWNCDIRGLFVSLRLLERDEWGKPPFRASIGLRIFSIKTTKSRKAKQKIIELPCCVKRAWSPIETRLGSFLYC